MCVGSLHSLHTEATKVLLGQGETRVSRKFKFDAATGKLVSQRE